MKITAIFVWITDALADENVGIENPAHKKLQGRDRKIVTEKARLGNLASRGEDIWCDLEIIYWSFSRGI